MGLNPADSVDRYINTSFDEVKKVADNIDTVVNAGEIADTHQVAAADPILRGDGSALQTGDTYFNTTVDIRYTYTVGLTWVAESTHDAAIVATAASQAAAAISETNAATSESNAATSETNAGIAKVAAEVAQTAAELAEANVTADLSIFVSGIGADVISTAALPLISDGNQFTVTGVIAITSMNTVAVGKVVFLTFAAALTLTHHATNLILPGGADIVTASGDVGIFQEYATGDWRCLNYQKIAYAPIVEGTWTPVIWDSSLADVDSQVYSSQVGIYTKIGRMVFIEGFVALSVKGLLTEGEGVRIGGLPFTATATNPSGGGVISSAGSLTIGAAASVTWRTVVSTTHMDLHLWDATTGTTGMLISELTQSSSFYLAGQYRID